MKLSASLPHLNQSVAKYHLTVRAEAELIDIFLFGIERFGLLQARRYSEALAACFQLLADNPRLGRPADAIAPGVRRHEHESHVILYEIGGNEVTILAVVHSSSVKGLRT